MNLLNQIIQAEARIRPYIRQTPLSYSPYFSQLSGGSVHFKLENIQHTGSFKVRGALNKVLWLGSAVHDQGIVTASTGNHGAATAYALHQIGGHGRVFVPENAAESKLDNMRQWGATIEKFGQDGVDTENHARATAEAEGITYISPYNDLQVAAGQGTIAVELGRQLSKIDTILIAMGGGGLTAGIATYAKSLWPDVEIVAVSPTNAPSMMRSVAAGKIVDVPYLPTWSDGTAGGVEPGSITFALCQQLADRFIEVSEQEIESALRLFMAREHMMIEGAAAVAVAGYLQEVARYKNKTVAVIICGGNIGLDKLKTILRN